MDSKEQIVKIVQAEIDTMLADFIRKFWYVVLGFGLASAAAWYGLYYQVQRLEAQQFSDVVYNKERIAENQKQIDILRADYKSDVKEIKEDLKYIREKI